MLLQKDRKSMSPKIEIIKMYRFILVGKRLVLRLRWTLPHFYYPALVYVRRMKISFFMEIL